MKATTEALNKAIEHAENLAQYYADHGDEKAYYAEQKRLVLFLKELKAMREAWDKLYMGLTKAEYRYDEKSYKAQANRALIHRMECLEKEFQKYQEVESEEPAEIPIRKKGNKKQLKATKTAKSSVRKKGDPAEGFMDCRDIGIEDIADVPHSDKREGVSEAGRDRYGSLKERITNLPYPSNLSVGEFVRQNYDKCFIIAIGSCDIPSEAGAYTAVLLFKGRSKILTEHRIVTTSANKCMLMGIRDATLAIKSPTDVIILTSTPLGFNSPNSVNSGFCREICKNLGERGCTMAIASCKGKGRELKNFVNSLSDAPAN